MTSYQPTRKKKTGTRKDATDNTPDPNKEQIQVIDFEEEAEILGNLEKEKKERQLNKRANENYYKLGTNF